MTARTPAGKLVCAFGDVEAMAKLYAPDIEWSLPASLPYPRPMRGYDAVVAFNRSVWSESYHPYCEVEILDEAGDDALSAVRFVYRARFRASGAAYVNEYTLFARSGPAGLVAVHEAMDSVAILDQIAGRPVGTVFAQAVAATRP